MVWSTVHDEMLGREILVVDPFTGTKKGTVERGTEWEEVTEQNSACELLSWQAGSPRSLQPPLEGT